jgi:xanthine permease XanP
VIVSLKPSNLLYGIDETPPLWVTFILSLQHVSLIAIGLVFSVMVGRESGASPLQTAHFVSVTMLAGGIGVMVQALHRGPVGSGYLCPQGCGPSYLSASMLAARMGGIPLVLGMTMCAGVLESLFSRAIKRLRFMFPAEVTGLIVAMVGITVIRMANQYFLAVGETDQASGIFVSCLTLALMVGLNVWSKGKLKMSCVLISMGVGYAASYALGILTDEHLSSISQAASLSFPMAAHPGWSFDPYLTGPFIVAMLCSSLKSVGDLTTCQKINDAKWKRPDMANISKGILADAVGCFSAGLLGGFGQSTYSSNIGLSIATGATSRAIAYGSGLLLIVLAFCPKLGAVFAIMPKPVMGATVIFSICFMVIAGIQIMMSRMMDARKTFVVGLSLIFGLSVDILPDIYANVHPWIQPIFSSSLSTATVSAVVLNLIFRIGIAKKVSLVIEVGNDAAKKIFTFMDRQGGVWGARKEIINKAEAALNEFVEMAAEQNLVRGAVTMEVSFDEYNLDIDIQYQGRLIEVSELGPSPEELCERPEALMQLAGFLIRQFADKVSTQEKAGHCHLKLHFEH